MELAAEIDEKAAQLQDLLRNSAAALPSVAEAVLSKSELMQFFADRGVVRQFVEAGFEHRPVFGVWIGCSPVLSFGGQLSTFQADIIQAQKGEWAHNR